MAYTAGNLHLRSGAPADLVYNYDAGSDALATVLVAGYFNNSDDDLNLVADDMIWVRATDGNAWFRVASVSSGSVTLEFAGGNLPIQTFATGTVASVNKLLVGYYDCGTAIATATRMELPTPYPGAEVYVTKADSGTAGIEFTAGSATTMVFNNLNDRETTLYMQGDYFHCVGSSATRWRVMGQQYTSTYSSGSVMTGGSLMFYAS